MLTGNREPKRKSRIRGPMRFRGCFLLALLTAPLFAQTSPAPHSGWKLATGGENLLVNGYWDTVEEETAPVMIQVSGGVLTASTQSPYLGTPNVLCARLQTTGDFGVVATVQTAAGMDGLITLTGTLNTGTQYWQGLTEIEFGVDNNGNYVFAYWNGSQSSPTLYQTLKSFASPPTGTVTMEMLHQQGQFFLYFNGAQYGPIADPGLFTLGYMIPGFELFPNQQMKLAQLAFEVPSSDTTAKVITPSGQISYVHPGDSVGSLAAVTGRTFGNAINGEQFTLGRNNTTTPGNTGGAPDPTYSAKIVGEFNSMVGATMYYFMTETGPGDFTFGDGDAIVTDAKANGLPLHCHHLIGPNIYLPGWVVNGNFSAAQLTQIMTTHIQTVMGHFKGQCASWDVVNEALNSDGTLDTGSDNVWAHTIGPGYIDIAFQTARQTDPGARLYYNDYYIEDQTPKTAGLYTLIGGMQQRGTPIDGVGLQCHWIPGNSDPNWLPNHDSMVANMAQLAKMGLSARISELDARLLLPASPAALANQATIFSTTVQACLDSPNCVSIAVWGATDATSWIDSAFPGYGAATMFDGNFQPKLAYTAVINTLRTAALAVATAPSLSAAAVASGASYADKGVAPGEIVTLFPGNAGPATLALLGLDSSGNVLTRIGGTRVLFDGIAAPMIYAVNDQISCVVPYEVAGETATQVQVEYNGILSVAVTVPVLPAVPGFLTVNSQGTGQAVAVNSDGSLNSASNPAARGDYVVLYATGEGQRRPAGVTGQPAPAYDLPILPVSMTIGGAAANLLYAASAPGFVGLMQIDVTIPQAAATGGAVPINLVIGTAQSPSVTIAVK